MPHLGHLPGVLEMTSGCMTQVKGAAVRVADVGRVAAEPPAPRGMEDIS